MPKNSFTIDGPNPSAPNASFTASQSEVTQRIELLANDGNHQSHVLPVEAVNNGSFKVKASDFVWPWVLE